VVVVLMMEVLVGDIAVVNFVVVVSAGG